MRLATILAIAPLIPLAAHAQSNRLLVYKYPMVPASEYIRRSDSKCDGRGAIGGMVAPFHNASSTRGMPNCKAYNFWSYWLRSALARASRIRTSMRYLHCLG
jgi:hypothetical protein